VISSREEENVRGKGQEHIINFPDLTHSHGIKTP
jgi:hypothetical protein